MNPFHQHLRERLTIAQASRSITGDWVISTTRTEYPCSTRTRSLREAGSGPTLQGAGKSSTPTEIRIITTAPLTSDHVVWLPGTDSSNDQLARPVTVLSRQTMQGVTLVEAIA